MLAVGLPDSLEDEAAGSRETDLEQSLETDGR
jgi:hypothetical protein